MRPAQKVLLLCDDASLIATRRALLESAGYVVIAVDDSHAARALLNCNRFDLILFGYSERSASNLSLESELRDGYPAIPLVRTEAAWSGADARADVVVQTGSPAELLATVRALVGNVTSEAAAATTVPPDTVSSTATVRDAEILLVEDNPADAANLRNMLRTIGFGNIVSVTDGSDAIAMLETRLRTRREIPAAIVLDLSLPLTSGYEVLRFCKRNPELKRAPVIIVSRVNSENEIQVCFYMGASSYIDKRLNESEILGKLRAALNLYLVSATKT